MLSERPWVKFLPRHLQGGIELRKKPLFNLVTETASAHPERVCLSYQGARMSYGRVAELSSRFASALVSMGLERGDRVALFMPNVPQFVIGYFGTLMAGGIVVPCSPLYRPRELEHQLRDSGSSFVVAANDVVRGNDLFASLEGCRQNLGLKRVIAASATDFLPPMKRSLAGLAGVKNVKRRDTTPFRDLLRAHGPLAEVAEVDPERDVAVLQYTGGTTGVAKGAMLTHYNLYSNAAMTAAALPVSADDVALTVLPLFHIYGMTAAMNAPLFAGSRMVLLPRFDVRDVMRAISSERVTSFCGVPTMYIAIINHADVLKFNLRSVRACISGGAPLPGAVSRRFMEITGGRLVEGYGLSEASPVTHCNPIGEEARVKEGSIGIPLPETDSAIVGMDDPATFLKPGEVGELAVRGPQVMMGYWQRPDETKKVLVDGGWLLTGDIAKMDEDGYFFIVDRKKDMIDVSGFKVYPREVEELLFEHPAVEEAAVVGVADEYRGESVRAYVVLKAESRGMVTEQDVVEFCRPRLARYKVPKTVLFVDELPKTLVGKVLRRRLREGDSATAAAGSGRETGPTEARQP